MPIKSSELRERLSSSPTLEDLPENAHRVALKIMKYLEEKSMSAGDLRALLCSGNPTFTSTRYYHATKWWLLNHGYIREKWDRVPGEGKIGRKQKIISLTESGKTILFSLRPIINYPHLDPCERQKRELLSSLERFIGGSWDEGQSLLLSSSKLTQLAKRGIGEFDDPLFFSSIDALSESARSILLACMRISYTRVKQTLVEHFLQSLLDGMVSVFKLAERRKESEKARYVSRQLLRLGGDTVETGELDVLRKVNLSFAEMYVEALEQGDNLTREEVLHLVDRQFEKVLRRMEDEKKDIERIGDLGSLLNKMPQNLAELCKITIENGQQVANCLGILGELMEYSAGERRYWLRLPQKVTTDPTSPEYAEFEALEAIRELNREIGHTISQNLFMLGTYALHLLERGEAKARYTIGIIEEVASKFKDRNLEEIYQGLLASQGLGWISWFTPKTKRVFSSAIHLLINRFYFLLGSYLAKRGRDVVSLEARGTLETTRQWLGDAKHELSKRHETWDPLFEGEAIRWFDLFMERLESCFQRLFAELRERIRGAPLSPKRIETVKEKVRQGHSRNVLGRQFLKFKLEPPPDGTYHLIEQHLILGKEDFVDYIEGLPYYDIGFVSQQVGKRLGTLETAYALSRILDDAERKGKTLLVSEQLTREDLDAAHLESGERGFQETTLVTNPRNTRYTRAIKDFKYDFQETGLFGTIDEMKIFTTPCIPPETSFLFDRFRLATLHAREVQISIHEDFDLNSELSKPWTIRPKKIEEDEPMVLVRVSEEVSLATENPEVVVVLLHKKS